MGDGSVDDERAKIEELRSIKRRREKEKQGKKGKGDATEGINNESANAHENSGQNEEDETAELRAEVRKS